MSNYIYNSNKWDGKYHEVHKTSCTKLPQIQYQKWIGNFLDCKSAIDQAKKDTGSHDFDGCAYCCTNCHKG